MKVGRKAKGRSEDDEDEAYASYDADLMDAEEEDSKLVAEARIQLDRRRKGRFVT